jgi:threonine synthase
MRYVSTRGAGPVTLDEALVRGLAADGGLFLPEQLPRFGADDFAGAASLPERARVLLAPFFAESVLETSLEEILNETFNFPVPCTPLPGNRSLLELYHGPTAAFKDVGAAFLAACLTRLEGNAAGPLTTPLTILVATSGDTGGAVAAAFDGRPGIRVVILYPEGRVSGRQAQQLSCWSENVLTLCVDGRFDDCQALVKRALGDSELAARYRFSSANSINIGRLLPQASYYADAAERHFRATGERPGFIIPTGNLGNGLAAVLAREVGLPIGPLVLATNANRTLPDYLETAEWQPRGTVATLASAMDVGDPSNMERLRCLLGDAAALRRQLSVVSVDDSKIADEIRRTYTEFGFAICPHTATAAHAWRNMGAAEQNATHWILVATAHPAKFDTVVEPLIGTSVPVPPELAAILSRPQRKSRIEPTLDALAAALRQAFG